MSNPYIASHFGGSLSLLNGARDGAEGEEFDGAMGFSKFTTSKHMKTTVFKPSRAAQPEEESAAKPAPARTPPDSIFKRRNLQMLSFPSRPATPGSLSAAGLPPLPPQHASEGGMSAESAPSDTPVARYEAEQRQRDGPHTPPAAAGGAAAEPRRVEWSPGRRPVTSVLSSEPPQPPSSRPAPSAPQPALADAAEGVGSAPAVSPIPAAGGRSRGAAEAASPLSGPPDAPLNAVDDVLRRSRAALTNAAELLGSASPPPLVEQYAAPPPAPFAHSSTDGSEALEEATQPETGGSSNRPVSPLGDDDFDQYLSPLSEVHPGSFPRERRMVRMPPVQYAAASEPDEERVVVASLCSSAAHQARRSLMRRAHVHAAAAYHTDPAVAWASTDRPRTAIELAPAAALASGNCLERAAHESAEARSPRHRRSRDAGRRQHRRTHRSRSEHPPRAERTAAGDDGAAVRAVVAQLMEFLHGGAPPPPFPVATGGSSGGADASFAPQRPGTVDERGAQRAVPQPTVLAGQRPARVSFISRRGDARERRVGGGGSRDGGGNVGPVPGYTLPTESWLNKNVNDADEWPY